jgi:hypothetical protein
MKLVTYKKCKKRILIFHLNKNAGVYKENIDLLHVKNIEKLVKRKYKTYIKNIFFKLN